MPSFKKSPPELVARFGRVAAKVPGAARKQISGIQSASSPETCSWASTRITSSSG